MLVVFYEEIKLKGIGLACILYGRVLYCQNPTSQRVKSSTVYKKSQTQIPWQRTQIRGETIPNRETHNQERICCSKDRMTPSQIYI